jgi:MSHA biogenesis protein MshK
MAETMKILLTLLALAGASVAHAQAVQDPTRPPQALLRPIAAGANAGAPQLQSILIGRGAGGRRVAVIDGDTVRVGDRVGGARVVAINAADVQLQRGGKRETLKLTAPEAAPTAAAAPAPTAGKPE